MRRWALLISCFLSNSCEQVISCLMHCWGYVVSTWWGSSSFRYAVRDYLNVTFERRGFANHYYYFNSFINLCWVGRGGPVHWLARSPDLSPLDCFLWGHMKPLVPWAHQWRVKRTLLAELRSLQQEFRRM